jgi:hypothetical protein
LTSKAAPISSSSTKKKTQATRDNEKISRFVVADSFRPGLLVPKT